MSEIHETSLNLMEDYFKRVNVDDFVRDYLAIETFQGTTIESAQLVETRKCRLCGCMFEKCDLDYVYPMNRERTSWTAHCPNCSSEYIDVVAGSPECADVQWQSAMQNLTNLDVRHLRIENAMYMFWYYKSFCDDETAVANSLY